MLGLADFFAGWVGGVAGLVVGHPMDTVKVRQQITNEPLARTILTTLKYEGVFGFYKGMLGPLVTVGLSNAIFFGVYGGWLTFIGNETGARVNVNNPLWKQEVIEAGIIGGLAQTIYTCPVEVVKTSLQVHTGSHSTWKSHYQVRDPTTWRVIKHIFSSNGFLGFFKGFHAMFWRDVPTSGIYMIVYEFLLIQNSNILGQIFAGGMAGIASWIFVIPLDVVKSRLQSDNPLKPKYKGMLDCFYKSYKNNGIKIFFKGTTVVVLRAFPVNAAILGGYEICLPMFIKLFHFAVQ